jgi:hypothetical protein
MKKTDVPQDPSTLQKYTKEVCYALDEKGNYTTNLSTGWEIKATALGVTWDDIHQRAETAKQKAIKGEISPLLYFIEIKLMDYATLAAYTGFWQWQIKRHLKTNVFNKLSDKKLQKYADIFEVSIENLKKMQLNEN